MSRGPIESLIKMMQPPVPPLRAGVVLSGLLLAVSNITACARAAAVYPPSDLITGMTFDMTTLRNIAPGNGASAPESDNWAITWADDGHQYTAFGDGVGFGTFNNTRASLGVARIEGGKDDYSAFDVFKTGSSSGGWGGKSLGIISIDGTLYMFRNGTASEGSVFLQTELYKSTDHAASFTFTGVRWDQSDDVDGKIFFSPAILQFGRDYAGARDDFVYIYANEHTASVSASPWNVQRPGRISLFRVPKTSMEDKSAYEYLAGFDPQDEPLWTPDFNQRAPVFEDNVNGTMRTSVSYNAGLQRYILVTQQVNRFQADDYHIGVYEAPEPWGPWSTVLFANAGTPGPGLNTGHKTVYWNFSNKWLSADGRDFVMVYTGDGADEWGTVEGQFIVDGTVPPTVNLNADPTTVTTGGTTLLTWSSTGATSCEASGGWSGAREPVNAAGETSPALIADTIFTLTCSNAAGNDNDSVTITVTDPAPTP